MLPYQTDFIELARRIRCAQIRRIYPQIGQNQPLFLQRGGIFQWSRPWLNWAVATPSRIVDSGVEFDVLLGPAYKGIPLATATAVALADHHGIDVPFAYNRKEAKSHGEGGVLVGAPLRGQGTGD